MLHACKLYVHMKNPFSNVGVHIKVYTYIYLYGFNGNGGTQ